jgi:C4-type Zn-finger protein
MKSPITGKEMKIQNEMFEVPYLGKIIPYMHSSYYCESSCESYTTTEIDELNYQRILNKHKLMIGHPNQV